MKNLKELEKDYLKKKEVYENAVTALAHSGSHKVDVKNAAEIIDSSYEECQKAYTAWQEAKNAQCIVVCWWSVRWNDGVMCVVLVCDGST